MPNDFELVGSWLISLRADRKSPSTIESYEVGVRLFDRWLAQNGHPLVLDRSQAREWIAELLDAGQSPATARARLSAIRRYATWLAAEGELDSDPLTGISPPKLTEAVVDRLTDEELAALLGACSGKAFVDLRDSALVRFYAETGARAREVLSMSVADVDIARGVAVIRFGKGAKQRLVPFGPQTARALDRYQRARRSHRLAADTAFWLGGGGQRFSYSAADKALKIRAAKAGVTDFHLHRLRHSAATRWLAAGGSEQGLMSMAGWSTRSMLDRYTKASASDRAIAESRTLDLGL